MGKRITKGRETEVVVTAQAGCEVVSIQRTPEFRTIS
jgi:hypothetical protein